MDELSFDDVVNAHYESLYRFALSLTRREADACDLTQQAFYRWATRGGQLRDKSKAKSWLFTTLYREFLGRRRHEDRYPEVEISTVDGAEFQTDAALPEMQLDGASALEALQRVDDLYRAPLTLFYLEEHSYREIAGILDVPIGTVMSRISRGRELLRRIVLERTPQ
jgi:RNA polymerase sigma-70 factor, ECF subfamily